MVVISCLVCGKERLVHDYVIKNGHGKYCSRQCSSIGYCGKKPNFINPEERRRKLSISHLGIKLSREHKEALREAWKNRNYSGSNNPAWKGGEVEKTCIVCGKQFSVSRYKESIGKGKACSHSCAMKSRKDERHPRWKGGVTPYYRLKRGSLDALLWRKNVFERDNYTCQKCNKRGEYLQAHHIIPFSLNEEERFNLSNGITFCKQCHLEYHSNKPIRRK